MKIDARSHDATTPTAKPATRRGLIVGAGAAGAAAVAAKVMLPGSAPQAVATTAAAAKPAVAQAAGYQLTQHVLRYYETTRA
ncbi:MAG TPA: twin-arginine translocation signal domain-containing protein [Burkholderiaceae bacterium]|nr:twin-arginine translocation signal domain-containing protein [Burkholderiaceae bacterium]